MNLRGKADKVGVEMHLLNQYRINDIPMWVYRCVFNM